MSAYRRRRVRQNGNPASRKLDEGIPIANKKQILGFFLMLSSLLVMLSIVSYSYVDQSRLEAFNLKSIFTKESQTASYDTANWLGMTGAYISDFFVISGFGYFSIIIPLLVCLAGIYLMRRKPLSGMLQFSVYVLGLMILLSSFGGSLWHSFGEKFPYTLAGRSGDYFSSLLTAFLGSVGSYILLSLLILVFVFLLADRDIIKSLARVKMFFVSQREKYRTTFAEIEEKSKSRKAEKSKDKPVRVEEKETEEYEIKETNINRPEEEFAKVKGEEKRTRGQAPLLQELEEAEVKGRSTHTRAGHETSEDIPLTSPKGGTPPEAVEEKLENFILPTLELLDEPLKEELELIPDEELKENGKLLQEKLLNFGVQIEKVIATPGPVVTLYELVPAANVKLSRIESLQDDIALALKAKGLRMIIPMPGKGTVGVEIPNHNPAIVKVKGVIASKSFQETNYQLPLGLGKTISGDVFIDDLAAMPHLLVAGATGSGKSVGINTIITSLLYKLHPADLKFVLIDPKKIELSLYSKLRNYYLAASPDIDEDIVTTPQNAVNVLRSVEFEMEKRYERLANAAVRNIADYNKKFEQGLLKRHGEEGEGGVMHSKMPYLIVIIDELADLMITAAREIEEPIARLAQLARAVGIHLVLATQRPSVDVITGVIKANFSARIAYLVNSKVDSRTILDMNGAEQLIGQGDMLYLPPRRAKPMRMQSPFISTDEVEKITDHINRQQGFSQPYQLPSVAGKKKILGGENEERDELFEEAARLFIRHQRGSTSLLQRRLEIGYARAARIVDQLEEAGIVGPGKGSKEREVLLDSESELEGIL
jgi:S-DNA-T family DNA segregation ATPase FtsK/SpoIIIE